MKLTIKERLLLQQLLPKEGNYLTLKVIMDLQSALGFPESELAELGITQENGKISWAKEKDKDIEIGEVGKKLIATALKDLDKQGKLTFDVLPLFDKFVGDN